MACCCGPQSLCPVSCTCTADQGYLIQGNGSSWFGIGSVTAGDPPGSIYKTFVGGMPPGGGRIDPFFGGISHPDAGALGNIFPTFTWKDGFPARLAGCSWGHVKFAVARKCGDGSVFLQIKAKWAIVINDCETQTTIDVTDIVANRTGSWEGIAAGSCGDALDALIAEPYWYPPITCLPLP